MTKLNKAIVHLFCFILTIPFIGISPLCFFPSQEKERNKEGKEQERGEGGWEGKKNHQRDKSVETQEGTDIISRETRLVYVI